MTGLRQGFLSRADIKEICLAMTLNSAQNIETVLGSIKRAY